MKKRYFGLMLSTLLIAAITSGCSSEGGGDQGSAETTGTSALALTASTPAPNSVTYTVTGDLIISPAVGSSGCTPQHTIHTVDTDTVLQDVLLPCTYQVTMPTAPVCTSSDSTPTHLLVSCSLLPVTQSFVVTSGATTAVSLSFAFVYNDQQQSTVMFSVGGADIKLNPQPTATTFCGASLACTGGSLCYALNGAATPQCYMPCDFVEGDLNGGTVGFAECTTSACVPVLPTGGTPLSADLDTVPGICAGAVLSQNG